MTVIQQEEQFLLTPEDPGSNPVISIIDTELLKDKVAQWKKRRFRLGGRQFEFRRSSNFIKLNLSNNAKVGSKPKRCCN